MSGDEEGREERGAAQDEEGGLCKRVVDGEREAEENFGNGVIFVFRKAAITTNLIYRAVREFFFPINVSCYR